MPLLNGMIKILCATLRMLAALCLMNFIEKLTVYFYLETFPVCGIAYY